MTQTTTAGIDIKALKVGDEMPAFTTPELGVTHFVKYAGASGDYNPLHHDPEFAKARGMDGIIGHGMLTAGYISAVFGMQMPGPGAIYVSQTLNFRAPVRQGDRVVA